MSDDFIETIWAQYAVETEEHIEGIEALLVRADGANCLQKKFQVCSARSTRSKA